MYSEREWLGSYHNRSTVPGSEEESPETIVDFWDTDKPASSLNGTGYEEYVFRDRILSILAEHDQSTPLFLTYASKIVHYPQQAPVEYQERFSFITDLDNRRMYHAMVGLSLTSSVNPYVPLMRNRRSAGQLSGRSATQYHDHNEEFRDVGQHSDGVDLGGTMVYSCSTSRRIVFAHSCLTVRVGQWRLCWLERRRMQLIRACGAAIDRLGSRYCRLQRRGRCKQLPSSRWQVGCALSPFDPPFAS